MSSHVNMADVAAARAVLAELAQRQEELGARLDASGLTSFAERVEWLRAHRSADEALAEERAWSRLFRRHRVAAEPRPRQVFVRPRSLSVPKVRRTRTVVDPERALALALGAAPVERVIGEGREV